MCCLSFHALFSHRKLIDWHNRFGFSNGNGWQELTENKVTGEEQSKCSEEDSYLSDGWTIVSPARRNIIAVERGYNNYETLEPHTNIHNDRHDENDGWILTDFF